MHGLTRGCCCCCSSSQRYSRGAVSIREGGVVSVTPGRGEMARVICACACDSHDSLVGGRTRAFKLVPGAESQCCEW